MWLVMRPTTLPTPLIYPIVTYIRVRYQNAYLVIHHDISNSCPQWETCLGKKHEDGSLIGNETLLASRSQHLCPQNELPCTYTAQEKKEGPDDNGRGC
jgi:hypothetical protein